MTAIEAIEQSLQEHGATLLERARQSGTDERETWLDALIARTLQDREFRVQALRFIDVLPALRDDAELVAHLQEYFEQVELPWPGISHWGLRHSGTPWAVHVAAPLVRVTLRGLSRRFMGGRNVDQALQTVRRVQADGMDFSLDLLGEAVISESEARRYQAAYLALLEGLADSGLQRVAGSPPATDAGSSTPAINISLKLSSLYSQINSADPDGSVQAIAERLRPILRVARDNDAFVTIDMEQYEFKHIVLQCFQEVLNESDFRDWPHVGIAIQAYLTDSRADLEQLVAWAEQRAVPVTIRLVRGAYWDHETVIARQHEWPPPVWQGKARTDACFESCLEFLLARSPVVETAVATHNPRSMACAMALAEKHGLGTRQFEFQMLYGMADEFKRALVEMGYRLRVYVPCGETLPGMSYLVRRLLENSSGQTLLDSGLSRSAAGQESLDKPDPEAIIETAYSVLRFHNTPPHRFTEAGERAALARAIETVREQLGRDYPLQIGGQPVEGELMIGSLNPARPDEVVGHVAAATCDQADQALAAARAAYPAWSRLPARERARYLRRAAELLGEQREIFSAWQIIEAGKNWAEADADVCEAIDFLNYYADQAEQLAEPRVVEIDGEHNQYGFQPRGIGLVITPWNFPLAILSGMLSATIVCGNTAILKPSSLTPVIAAQFMQLLDAAGLPPGVVNFLPGAGQTVGEYLARHPEVSLIAFTGSRAVGTRLLKLGARTSPGQTQVKRVIAEMGGKNAIIIDQDADLDDAIPGVVHSAFGYQGQKCSAASRVIVVGDLYEVFVERLVEATRSLTMGDPRQPGHFMGPVIDAEARARIAHTIEQAQQRATLVYGHGQALPDEGHYLAPSIFTDIRADDPLAREEIFGPVLAVLHADSFDQAIEIANSTSYALTGGVYSRQPSHLQQARRKFQVGNLYLNRKITGAIVSRQQFGGFRMSGIGSKAGGEDYLKQFMDPVCVTENTLRRGFAPDVGTDNS
ncbi:MAG: L-glutamate gamma-semialdehyde dehydrogenase [Halobacteria archaeon]|nr:L-glutamate gamma-semialdehyde dehydrogenase [Halobacteria archaeon]